jgi:hypothetical protein
VLLYLSLNQFLFISSPHSPDSFHFYFYVPEQVTVQKKLLEREQALYNTLLERWGNSPLLAAAAGGSGTGTASSESILGMEFQSDGGGGGGGSGRNATQAQDLLNIIGMESFVPSSSLTAHPDVLRQSGSGSGLIRLNSPEITPVQPRASRSSLRRKRRLSRGNNNSLTETHPFVDLDHDHDPLTSDSNTGEQDDDQDQTWEPLGPNFQMKTEMEMEESNEFGN